MAASNRLYRAPIDGPAAPPCAADIRLVLERMARSRQLRAAPRLVGFLRYVVERTLEGRSGEIKSYTIAVEALARAPNFDPQSNPIVRVEAVRLRQALARYYSDDGRDDAVVIDFARGSYVPMFRWREPAGGTRGDDRASLVALVARLSSLQRQLELATTEIERTWRMLEEPDRPRQRRR